MNTYRETLDFLFSRLPMFQRVGAAAYKANLDNTLAICRILEHPENKFRSVHIAGTNGKGSVSSMLASVFQSAGYKTGLYTSPHLRDFRERIRINGKMIPEKEVVEFVSQHSELFSEINPSFFEWTVGLAFDYFAREKTEIAIIETGLGGRLDSTNVISPEISVITNIGMDHSHLLGDNLQKIAREKAGIIKPQIPVVIGEAQKATIHVFREVAAANQSSISIAMIRLHAVPVKTMLRSLVFDIYEGKNCLYAGLELGLAGSYQQKNVITVLQTIRQLTSMGWQIPERAIRDGLKHVTTLTGLQGRWQVISEKPLCICDVAHNKEGVEEIVAQIRNTSWEKLHIVFGVVSDKDIGPMLGLLPKEAEYYFCKADLPRAMETSELLKHAAKSGLCGNAYPSVREAFDTARRRAGPNDLVFTGGSTFVVAEVLSEQTGV